MALRPSTVHEQFTPRQAQAIAMTAADAAMANVHAELGRLGINLGGQNAQAQLVAWANDAAPNLQPTSYAGSMAVAAQFLQSWLPGLVSTVTAVMTIDEIAGIATVGDWEDEEIIQGTIEPTGLAQLYGDHTPAPLASWNTGFERRTIVRFEQGFEVGILEDLRSAKARIQSAARKREASAVSLNIQRNRVGFYGFNNGAGRTYGFLNDPSIGAYVTVPNGAAGTPGWATKTFLEITADIRTAVGKLMVQAGGLIKGGIGKNVTPMTLVLPLGLDNFMSVTSVYGNSVADWLLKTYPNMRVITAPELVGANGGVNAFYLYAERVEDGQSDDGGQTLIQMVPTKMRTIGSEKRLKTYVEDFANATAGVMFKRPYAVVRYSGI